MEGIVRQKFGDVVCGRYKCNSQFCSTHRRQFFSYWLHTKISTLLHFHIIWSRNHFSASKNTYKSRLNNLQYKDSCGRYWYCMWPKWISRVADMVANVMAGMVCDCYCCPPFRRRWITCEYVFIICVPWPWPDDLDTQTWPRYSEDVTAYQVKCLGQVFQS